MLFVLITDPSVQFEEIGERRRIRVAMPFSELISSVIRVRLRVRHARFWVDSFSNLYRENVTRMIATSSLQIGESCAPTNTSANTGGDLSADLTMLN